MFFISRRFMRGRSGNSLIITGIVLLVLGLAITVGTYAWADSHGGGHYYITFSPIIIGVIAIVRGVQQKRRGTGYLGGPGQAMGMGMGMGGPQPGYGYQSPAAGQPAANWYPDPQNPSMLRWWDGQSWTQNTQPRG